ncbi:MAG: hypothetical protein AAFQ57_04930 [Cyanobacteria bacterium J06626_14]
MAKRTSQTGFEDWEDAQTIDQVVVDKRQSKRAGRTKGRRRDRRYENRLLRTTLDALELEIESPSFEAEPTTSSEVE